MSFTWSLSCPALFLNLYSSQCLGISTEERPKGKVRLTVLLSVTCWQPEWNALWVGRLGLLDVTACLLSLPVDCAATSPSLQTLDWGALSGFLATKTICIYIYLIFQNMWCNFTFQKHSESPYFHQLHFFPSWSSIPLEKSHMFQTLPLFLLLLENEWLLLYPMLYKSHSFKISLFVEAIITEWE